MWRSSGVGRQRFAEARQVAWRFGMDERNAYRRLRGLVSLALLEHRRVFTPSRVLQRHSAAPRRRRPWAAAGAA